MISRSFIGWAVLVTVLVGVAFSGFAYDVSPSVFWNWLGTLLATFISVLAAVGVGLLLFNYQTRVTDERKRRDLVHLTVTELNSIIHTLQRRVDEGNIGPVSLHCPISEQAARSGLLDPQTTADIVQFAWNVQQNNQLVLQFTMVENSIGMNPLASNTLFQQLLSMGRQNRDTMKHNAEIILRQILEKYPGALAQD